MRGFKIDRLAGQIQDTPERPSPIPTWMEGFVVEAKRITAVEVARRKDREEASLYDQMKSALQGRPRYSSTEEAIKDYQEKTGLTAYLRQINASKNVESVAMKILASEDDTVQKPELVQRIPAIETFIRNKVESNKMVGLPGLLYDLMDMFRLQGIKQSDIEDEEFLSYINDILKSRSENSSSLSDLQNSNIGKDTGLENIKETDQFANVR